LFLFILNIDKFSTGDVGLILKTLHGNSILTSEGATYIRQGGHHVGHWPTF